jgi:3',5'-cyclic AMP phosphodiesterase CpdA
MNTTGNHDTDHPETYAHFVQTFHYPYPNPEIGAYYHFIYGNALFMMIDSTNAGQSAAIQGVASDQQLEWIEKTLKQYAKQNLWVFIVMHHPMYTTGDTGFLTMYELAYKDLFEEYHVDGVFYGHDHFFELMWSPKESEWGGTHYCMVGNAGGPLGYANLDGKKNPPPPYLWKGRTYIYERDGMLGGRKEAMRNDAVVASSYVYGIIEYGFTHLHIEGDSAEMKMWGRQNQIYFRDTFKRTGCGKKFQTPQYMAQY